MQIIQKILCPTDFSETAKKAVDYAAELALESGAELHLIHSFETMTSMGFAGQTESIADELHQQMNAVLQGSLLEPRLHRWMHAGMPGEVICWMAQEHGCDVIVMGTHGRSGFKHLALGSVTEYVMRHARCPVLTIRDRPLNEPPLPEPVMMPIKAPRFM